MGAVFELPRLRMFGLSRQQMWALDEGSELFPCSLTRLRLDRCNQDAELSKIS
jgi:hypothetical protein